MRVPKAKVIFGFGRFRALWVACGAWVFFASGGVTASSMIANDIPRIIRDVKHSVLAVGTFQATRNPGFQFRGTGFVVGSGSWVATNAHVLPQAIDEPKREVLAVARLEEGGRVSVQPVRVLAVDPDHDLALLEFTGKAVFPALPLGDDAAVTEGGAVVFTGFPLGAELGMRPVTHRGIISAITPIGTPTVNARDLTPNLVRRLGASYDVFQLDATAYPGNSGSPLLSLSSGEVIGVINLVFVKGAKENALSQPSGITYAVPVQYLKNLMVRVRR